MIIRAKLDVEIIVYIALPVDGQTAGVLEIVHSILIKTFGAYSDPEVYRSIGWDKGCIAITDVGPTRFPCKVKKMAFCPHISLSRGVAALGSPMIRIVPHAWRARRDSVDAIHWTAAGEEG